MYGIYIIHITYIMLMVCDIDIVQPFRYEKPGVNCLGFRQTEARWSFDYLHDPRQEQEVTGGTVTTTAGVIDGAVLVVVKLHSSRETDCRDVLMVAEEINPIQQTVFVG
jgi:hypothetical protein